jgi:hypothetical protein
LNNCAVLLLAHVDKATSKARKAESGEGYSGSTAWHNSVRSRLFMSRADDGSISLEHQKSNFGKLHDPIKLIWPQDGLPMLVGDQPKSSFADHMAGRVDDDNAIALLKMIAEFESRNQFCSPAPTARNSVYLTLKPESNFLKLHLTSDSTKRIVTNCQRAKWLDILDYRGHGKTFQRWTVTPIGRAFAGLPSPHIPTPPHIDSNECEDVGVNGGCPTPPHPQGGTGGSAHTFCVDVSETVGGGND